MIPRRIPLLLAVAAAAASCDTSGGLVFAPELEADAGFESGLSPWTVDMAGTGIVGAQAVTGQASEGSGSVQFDLSGDAPDAVWVERAYPLTAGVRYDVTLQFDVASADNTNQQAWSVITAITGSDPGASAVQFQGDTGRGSGGQPLWETRTVTGRVTADDEGRVWVAVGIRARSPGDRQYFLDAVQVTFMRTDP